MAEALKVINKVAIERDFLASILFKKVRGHFLLKYVLWLRGTGWALTWGGHLVEHVHLSQEIWYSTEFSHQKLDTDVQQSKSKDYGRGEGLPKLALFPILLK